MIHRPVVARHGHCRWQGFSLLEVLIVLVILGMILGFTGVKFDSYRLQLRLQNEARSLQSQIQRRQLVSLAVGQPRTIDADSVEHIMATTDVDRHANGVTITVPTPLQIRRDGSCSDGLFLLDLQAFRYQVAISAPLCDATITRVK